MISCRWIRFGPYHFFKSFTCSALLILTSTLRQYTLSASWMCSAVMLPIGGNVSLQHLSFYSYDHACYFSSLANLQFATQLTSIEFTQTYADNLFRGEWPAFMPKLQVIKADEMFNMPPQQLLGYKSLRHLEWPQCCIARSTLTVVPKWFSNLTQSESLRLHFGISEFPVCLLQLKQLRSLDLSWSGPAFRDLSAAILQFVGFPALTRLDLSNPPRTEGDARVSSDNEQLLARLKEAMRLGVLQY